MLFAIGFSKILQHSGRRLNLRWLGWSVGQQVPVQFVLPTATAARINAAAINTTRTKWKVFMMFSLIFLLQKGSSVLPAH
jgi:hypothetical protein